MNREPPEQPWPTDNDPAAQEIQGETPYLDVLESIHRDLDPSFYLEIGVRLGRSLSLSRTRSVGVDPDYDIRHPLAEAVVLFKEDSDTFYSEHAADAVLGSPAFAFIDGLHLFEFVLRDFMNTERLLHPASLVALDDVSPNHPLQATRQRRSRVWMGDVWKLQICLREYRPELTQILIDTRPSGLLLVAGLDARNEVLWDNYQSIVKRFGTGSDHSDPPSAILNRHDAVAADAPAVRQLVQGLRRLGASDAGLDEVRQVLRSVAGKSHERTP